MLHTLFCFNLHNNIQGLDTIIPVITEKQSEDQRDAVIFPGRHNLPAAKLRSKPQLTELLPSTALPLSIKVYGPILQMTKLRPDSIKYPNCSTYWLNVPTLRGMSDVYFLPRIPEHESQARCMEQSTRNSGQPGADEALC